MSDSMTMTTLKGSGGSEVKTFNPITYPASLGNLDDRLDALEADTIDDRLDVLEGGALDIEQFDVAITDAETEQLVFRTVPYDETAVVTWESDDEDVATVSAGGLITGVGAGTCVVTGTITGGGSCSVDVTVTAAT